MTTINNGNRLDDTDWRIRLIYTLTRIANAQEKLLELAQASHARKSEMEAQLKAAFKRQPEK